MRLNHRGVAGAQGLHGRAGGRVGPPAPHGGGSAPGGIGGRREKTGKTKTAYIREPLLSLLKADRKAVKRLPTALVFLDGQGRPWNAKTRNRRLRDALAAVPEKTIPAWKRQGDAEHLGFDFHGLRHTVHALWRRRGHRAAVVGSVLGQSDAATWARYDHALAGEAEAVAEDVAKMLRPRKGRAAGG